MPAAEAKVIQLHLNINGQGAFDTLKNLNEHIATLRQRMNRMNRDEPSYTQAAQKLRDCIEKQAAWREEIYGTKKAAKGFLDDFKGGLAGIAGAVSVDTLVASGIQAAIGAVSSFFSGARAAYAEAEQNEAQSIGTRHKHVQHQSSRAQSTDRRLASQIPRVFGQAQSRRSRQRPAKPQAQRSERPIPRKDFHGRQ